MCNDQAGYQPTRLGHNGGGMEARIGPWSKFGPECLEIVERETRDLITRLYA